MARPRLHLDADTSRRALYQALLERGHDVTRTPNEWMPADASDEQQLNGATEHGRCLFSFNIRDFMVLAQCYPGHGGIILAAQRRMALADIVSALDCLLTETEAGDWPGQVRWLSDWHARRPAR